MDLDANIVTRIIGAIICLVIGGISANITIETYNKIYSKEVKDNEVTYKFSIYDKEYNVSPVRLKNFSHEKSNYRIIREPIEWLAKYNQSNRFAILYSSVFVFCVSLCCFTYICVKK
tara:strand:- start:401 stop:751 length:351 start_codon:yes stop_codon:yes gene_type:complete